MNAPSDMAIGRPSWPLLGAEPWRAAAEYITSKVSSPRVLAPGDGHPVVVFPGLASDGRAVAPMCSFLRRQGYAAMDWGRGWNTGPQGDVDHWLDALARDVVAALGPNAPAPTLIGWSLGGLYARELAKRDDLPVRQVITIGTPFNGRARHTHAGWVYRLLNGTSADLPPAWQQRLRTPPGVPTTSVYSRSDGIVAWQACCHDRTAAQVQDIEVRGSHLGLCWNRQVLGVVANRLAQAPGRWQPYGGGPGMAGHAAGAGAGTSLADRSPQARARRPPA